VTELWNQLDRRLLTGDLTGPEPKATAPEEQFALLCYSAGLTRADSLQLLGPYAGDSLSAVERLAQLLAVCIANDTAYRQARGQPTPFPFPARHEAATPVFPSMPWDVYLAALLQQAGEKQQDRARRATVIRAALATLFKQAASELTANGEHDLARLCQEEACKYERQE